MSINDVYLQLRQAWSQSLPASPDQLFRKLAEIIEDDTPPGDLGTMSVQNADNVNITGGTITGVSFPGVLGTMASQNANAVNITGGSVALSTISGLGTMASQNANAVNITGGSIPSSVITGLGSMAAQNSNNVAITGGSITGVSFPGVLGTIASQNANAVAITGGNVDGTSIGNTTAAPVVNALRASNSPTGAQTTIAIDPSGEPDTYLLAAYSGRVKRTGKITAAPTGFSSVSGAWRFAYEDGTSAATVQQSAVTAIMLATGNAASVTANEEQSQRNALQAKIAITGVYGSVSAPDPYIAFCGIQSETSISTDQGGIGGWTPAVSPAAPYLRGSAFGLNSLSIMRNGAVNWVENMAMEITISNQAGSSAGRKIGLHISKKGDDAVAALSGDESAISIASFGSIPWVEGLSFGWKSGAGNWPFDNTSTLMGITGQVWPVARDRSFRPANIGVDMREATFTTASYMWPGGFIDPAGNIIWTVPGAAPTLAANGQIAIYAFNNTNVRIVYRGSDGTTRQSANIPVS